MSALFELEAVLANQSNKSATQTIPKINGLFGVPFHSAAPQDTTVWKPQHRQSSHSDTVSWNQIFRLAWKTNKPCCLSTDRRGRAGCVFLRGVSRRHSTNDRCCYAKRGRHWREGVECCHADQECSTKHKRGKQNTTPLAWIAALSHSSAIIISLYIVFMESQRYKMYSFLTTAQSEPWALFEDRPWRGAFPRGPLGMQRKIGNPNNYFECKNYYYNQGFCLMLFLFYIFFRSSKSTKNLPMIIVVYLGWGLFFTYSVSLLLHYGQIYRTWVLDSLK